VSFKSKDNNQEDNSISFWIIIAVIGIILSMMEIIVLIRRYLQGEINLLYLVSIIIGFLSFLAFAFVDNVYSESVSRPVRLIILLPAIVTVFYLVHLFQKSRKVPH